MKFRLFAGVLVVALLVFKGGIELMVFTTLEPPVLQAAPLYLRSDLDIRLPYIPPPPPYDPNEEIFWENARVSVYLPEPLICYGVVVPDDGREQFLDQLIRSLPQTPIQIPTIPK